MEVKIFIDKVFDTAKNMNLEEFEIYFVSSKNETIKVFKGEIDTYNNSENMGISFRVKVDGKMGYSYTESLLEEDIFPLIERAISNGKIIENSDEVEIYKENSIYEDVNSFNPELENIPVEEKINFLLKAEKTALELDSRVKAINYCMIGSGFGENIIKNSEGLDLYHKSNSIYAYIAVVVQEGDSIKNDSAYIVTRDFSNMDPIKLSTEAVTKALNKLNSTSVESKEYNIIIENDTFADLLGAMSGIFSGEAVQKGVSKFKGKLNTCVASSIVTITDDPLLKDGYGSAPFDAEGVPTKRKNLIENGVLKTYIHNLKTAKKDGIKTTGNAAKGGYKGTMGISTFNLFLQKGDLSFNQLLNKLDNGILVTGFSGLHSGLNSISGDFSLATEGFLIENGKIIKPLNQITVAGNFFNLLNNIEDIADDLKFNLSGIGSPSLLVKNISVSS
ncbi:TldD/PmbA family protein [Cetobacterium somerae]|uniref:TldD/PmbA family protein n=1 Tax=Cetobacterium sp. NK01 TaxID=2993530 RepID=UPI0021171CE4|nr:TldD/PmbA family protein [Cetobacterium sp. NK01]MCQ8213112.1 TldD/PmbA family protein [Cetobacterium sp. NK01]